jgi:hypothetical protein
MPGRIPHLKFVEEGSGDVLFRVDSTEFLLKVGDSVTHSTDGGASTTYKIEKVTMVLDDALLPPPIAADGYASIIEYVIELSVVP